MKHDALGREIDYSGNTIYGYAGNDRGFNSIWIGIPVRETKTGVTINVLQRRHGMYGDAKVVKYGEIKGKEPFTYVVKHAKSVNVKSVMLFPIHHSFLDLEETDVTDR